MRVGGSKQKGSAFERDVCKKLSLWVTKGKRGDVFWRSAMSGGRGTIYKGVQQVGDICAVAEEGFVLTNKYYMECKFVRDLQLDSFLLGIDGGEKSIFRYWKETKDQARIHKRTPLLIAKQNRKPTIIITNDTLLDAVWKCSTVDVAIVALFDDLLKTRPPR